jgi:hypothetical protein
VNTPTEELLETADWLDERAAVLERVSSAPRKELSEVLRQEIAKIRGRAWLLRFNATNQIPIAEAKQ